MPEQQLPCPKCGRTWWWTKNTKPYEAICPPCSANDVKVVDDRIEKLEAEIADLKAKLAKAVEEKVKWKDD